MKPIQPVMVKNTSFNFCKYGVAVLLWIAFIVQSPLMVGLAALILGSSALLGVQRAPMIVLGNLTISKLIPSDEVMLDVHGMRFAHSLGCILNAASLIAIVYNPKLGWSLVFMTAILKSVSAVGYCSGLKLYQCMNNDSCCQFAKVKRGNSDV